MAGQLKCDGELLLAPGEETSNCRLKTPGDDSGALPGDEARGGLSALSGLSGIITYPPKYSPAKSAAK